MPIEIDIPRAIVEEILWIGRGRASRPSVDEPGVQERLDDRLGAVVTIADPARPARHERAEGPTRAERCELNGEPPKGIGPITSNLGELGQAPVLVRSERFEPRADPDHA